MPLINVLLVLIVVGVLLWLVNTYIPMDRKIKNILNDTATLSDAPNSEEGEEITNISMKNITSSATKLVLLYIVFILGMLATFAVVWGIIHDSVNELTIAIVTSFTGIVGVVIGHYFNKPGDPTLPGGGK